MVQKSNSRSSKYYLFIIKLTYDIKVMKVSWYPRNFTNPDLNNIDRTLRISDDALYAVQLGLYVIGYKEFKDDKVI